MVNISNWMHVDTFTIDQASALWCNLDPSVTRPFDLGTPSEVLAAKQILIGGILSGELEADSSQNRLHRIGNYSRSLVSRPNLVTYAKVKKLYPPFLFDTIAPFVENDSPFQASVTGKLETSHDNKPINRGGRPQEHDWDTFTLEVICKANSLDGLPDTQSELVKEMQTWFQANYGNEPAESSVKSRISKIYRYLNDQNGEAKNSTS